MSDDVFDPGDEVHKYDELAKASSMKSAMKR